MATSYGEMLFGSQALEDLSPAMEPLTAVAKPSTLLPVLGPPVTLRQSCVSNVYGEPRKVWSHFYCDAS